MDRTVFISYSSRDAAAAQVLVAALEARALPCWIAPRDIAPGTRYAAALIAAIKEASAVVLVFSSRSNVSPHVLNELERALHRGVPILPVRIDDLLPDGEMEYYLGTRQWLDALPPPIEQHLTRIVEAVEALVGAAPTDPVQAAADEVRPLERRATLDTYAARVRIECAQTFTTDLVRPDRLYVPQYAAPPAGGEEAALESILAGVWEKDGGRSRVAILGNYGMGKTYLAWRALLDQVERLESSREQAIPILYPLRRFSYADAAAPGNPRDLVQQVLGHAMALEFPGAERDKFVGWLRDGVVGVILDGLDELSLPRQARWQDVLAPLTDIPGARVVVTSRSAYLSRPEEDLAGYEVYELQAWGDREWRQYVESSLAEGEPGAAARMLAQVADRPKLSTLTSRPLWCYMIVSLADGLPNLPDMAQSGLYQRFLDHAVTRRPLMDAVLTLAWQYCAMERFADECLGRGVSAMAEEELLSLLSRLFESVGHGKLREFLSRQVRTYAFLNCDRERRHSFGHKSFEDYFGAAGAARWLAEQATGTTTGPDETPRMPHLLTLRRMTPDQALFLAGILEDGRVRTSLELPGDGDLTERLLEYLDGELRGFSADRVYRSNLFRIALDLRRSRDNPEAMRFTGLRLVEANLAGLDMSGAVFEDVDFTDAVLSRALFKGSVFSGCPFFGATVDGANFSGANLAGADLTGVDVGTAPPVLAGATGIDPEALSPRERRFLFG